jgi:hypothetical protein
MREKPTAHQLFEELQVKGYRGSETQVKDFVARLRRGFSGMRTPSKSGKNRRGDTNSFSEGVTLAPCQTREKSQARRKAKSSKTSRTFRRDMSPLSFPSILPPDAT